MQLGRVQSAIVDSQFFLRFCGDVRLPWCVTLENFCTAVFAENELSSFKVDLNTADNLDSTTLGILAKVIQIASAALGSRPTLYCVDDSIYRLLWSMGFEHIATISREPLKVEPVYSDIEMLGSEEREIRDSVIDAHQRLMEIDERNISKFSNLVDALKKDR